ncbi:hypothetical protein ACFHW2_11725 [Actinomadura sp. LOL_016]|uniref:hypothetical protein n=1 Tax=unclassified Actinomadura TaxID=2626254 RepID=UPI003A7FC399
MTLIERLGPASTAVSSHQFLLQSESNLAADPLVTNGLIWRCPSGGAVIYTGIADGKVMVTVERHNQMPPLQTESWEAVVEINVEAAEEGLFLSALDADRPDISPVATDPGTYRVRAHVRGRDEAYDLAVLNVVEHYLLQIWPSPPAPQTVHKHADQCSENMTTTPEGEISTE